MCYEFRWNEWNIIHIAEHGVTPEEAEYVVNHARNPFPRRIGEGKYYVAGQTEHGYYLQVIFIVDPMGSLFVIHARPLREHEKRRVRRGRKT